MGSKRILIGLAVGTLALTYSAVVHIVAAVQYVKDRQEDKEDDEKE